MEGGGRGGRGDQLGVEVQDDAAGDLVSSVRYVDYGASGGRSRAVGAASVSVRDGFLDGLGVVVDAVTNSTIVLDIPPDL